MEKIIATNKLAHNESLKDAHGTIFDKATRILTVAPIMAGVLLALVYGLTPSITGGYSTMAVLFSFLTILPLLAYPLQRLIPKYRKEGRKGQRNLAIIFAFLGYIFAAISCGIMRATTAEWLITLTYLFSGLFILLLNLLGKRASGHACGVVGPSAMLIYLMGSWALFCLIPIILVIISSLRMKRHTLAELFFGGIVPLLAMIISALILTF